MGKDEIQSKEERNALVWSVIMFGIYMYRQHHIRYSKRHICSPSGEVPVLVPLFVQLHAIAIILGLNEEWLVLHEPKHLIGVGGRRVWVGGGCGWEEGG